MGYNSKYNGAEVEAILDRVGDCITKGESVDFATDLTGVPEATHEEFTYRPSAGRKSIRDKSAVIRRIKGNSLVWNQLATFKDSWTGNGLTCVKEGNTIHLYGTVTKAFTYDICQLTTYLSQGLKRDGRKYLISLNAPDGVAYGINGYPIEKTKPHFWSAEADSVWFGYISIKIPVGTTVDYVFSNPQIIDLTLMFGAGNEPSTIEEFYARIPKGIDANASNNGELISMNANAIETNGFNQWDEEWEVGEINENTGENADVTYRIRSKNFIPIIGGETYNFHCASNGKTLYFSVVCYDENKKFIGAVKNGIYPSTSATSANYNNPWTFEKDVAYIRFATAPLYGTTYKNDICINLSHSGVRNGEYEPYEKNILLLPEIAKYFSDGMHGIGDVCDEIIDGLAIQRIGEVDLGNSDIKYDSVRSAFYLRLYNSKTLGKGICPKFTLNNLSAVNLSDGEMSFHNTYYEHGVIFKATSYTDVTSFKSAMAGVKLYYELVEPIYTPIDEPLQLAYEVNDFGTEKMLSDAPSSPFKADIVYQFNAEGRIRDNSRNIESLEKQIKTIEDATPYVIDDNENVTFPEKVVARSFEDRDGNAVMLSKDIPTEVATATQKIVGTSDKITVLLPNVMYEITDSISGEFRIPQLFVGDVWYDNVWMIRILTAMPGLIINFRNMSVRKTGYIDIKTTCCLELYLRQGSDGIYYCDWKTYS